ncbi:MAG: M15 family metallopeptidase [Minisyncoccia bacterium]
MKVFKVLSIVIFLLIPCFTYGTSSDVVKCPKPPKDQPVVNYFLTSFTDAGENLQNYIPRDLVLINKKDTYNEGNYCLRKPVYDAFKRMNNAMKLKTGMSLKIRSGFRSYNVQVNFKKIYGNLAADPGRSEHQLGTAIDIIGGTPGEKLLDSKEYVWLQKNAAKYGFVQSYPDERIEEVESIDTTKNPNIVIEQKPDLKNGEAWHWRYIGEETAIKIPKSMKLGEYLNKVKLNKENK